MKCKHCPENLLLAESGLICPNGCGGVIPMTAADRMKYPRHLIVDGTKVNTPIRKPRKPAEGQLSLFEDSSEQTSTTAPED